MIRDHRSLDAYTYTIGLAGIVFLLLPIAPGVGETINGARLWVRLGPVSFQPSELAKVLIVIFLASYLSAKKELLAVATRRIGPIRLPEPRYLGPLLLAWLLSLAVLFLEKDLGSSLLFFGVFVVMLWVATGRVTFLVLGVLLFAVIPRWSPLQGASPRARATGRSVTCSTCDSSNPRTLAGIPL